MQKTTLIGAILGGLIFVQTFIKTEAFDISKDWLQLVVGVGVVVLGYLVPDQKPTN